MLKKLSIRKILVSTATLFALLLIYLIPKEENILTDVKQELSYVDNTVITNPIFLLNNHNMLGRTMVVVNNNNSSVEARAKELIEILINGGSGESKIPNGFKSILPSETKILSVKYEEGLLKINFSKELLDINEELENKMIEAIVYTLTTIEDIQNIIIYVDGDILNKLPKSGTNLPSTLNRDFGINKSFEFTSLDDINKVTIYYIDKFNDNYYYVPVTKYLNDSREKINIIVDSLSSSSVYNTNLMSFLNSNTELLAVEHENDVLELSFNSYIFNDINKKDILEEVIYTISLSVKDNYDVKEVIFNVNDEEIYKSVLKSIE